MAHDWLGHSRYRDRLASSDLWRIFAGEPRHFAGLPATYADFAYVGNRARANLHADGELVAVGISDLHSYPIPRIGQSSGCLRYLGHHDDADHYFFAGSGDV